MKRLSKSAMLQLLAILCLGIIISCSKKDETEEPAPMPPSLTIESPVSTTVQAYPGQAFNLTVVAASNPTSGAPLSNFTVIRTFADSSPVTEMDSSFSDVTFSLVNFPIHAYELNGLDVWTLKVTDNAGESAEASFTFEITGVAPDFSPQMILKTGTHSSGNPYISDDQTLQINFPFAIGVEATANNESQANLSHLKIERIFEQVSTSIAYDEELNAMTFSVDVQTISYPAVGDELWRITLTDENNEQAIKEFTITTIVADPGISTYNNITLGSYASVVNGAIDADLGTVYSLAEANDDQQVQAKIDWLYYEGATGGHTLMSPSNNNISIVFPSIDQWQIRNETMIGLTALGVTDFNSIENISQLIALIQGQLVSGNLDLSHNFYSQNMSSPGGFEVGDIIAFESSTGNYGLIRIKQINPGVTTGESEIVIDLKVEK